MANRMTLERHTENVQLVRRTCEALAVITGIWMVIAPFGMAMDFAANNVATWSTVLVGIAAIATGVAAIREGVMAASAYAIMAVAGVWAIMAPYLLTWPGGSSSDSAVNSIWMGVALVVLGLAANGATLNEKDETR